MKKKQYVSYQVELALVVGFCMTLIIIAFSLMLYFREMDNSKIRAVNSLEAAVTQVRKNLELEIYILNRLSYSLASHGEIIRILTEINRDLQRERDSLELWENTNAIERILFRQTEAWRNLEGILILAKDGSTYYGSGASFLAEGYDLRQQGWYRSIQGRSISSDMRIDRTPAAYVINGFPSLSVIRKIYNPDTAEVIGTMKIDVSLERIEDTLADLEGYGSFRHYIMDLWGELLLGEAPESPAPGEADLRDMLEFHASGRGVEKEGRILFPMKIQGTSWFLVYEFPLDGILESRRAAFLLQTLIILVVGVCAALVTSIVISRGFSRNIIDLKRAMEVAESGNLDVQVHFRSRDEIGLLGESFNRMTANLKELYQQLYRAEIDTREARIKALQARINPHFMFNTLECIDSLAMVDNNPRISRITRALSQNFQYAFEKGRFATLAEEQSHASDYIQIIQIRYPGKLTIRFDIPAALHACLIPRLTLQPIIENAVLHGILKSRSPGWIAVTAEGDGESLTVRVEDNGIGIPPDALAALNMSLEQKPGLREKHQSGLINVNNRLKFLFRNSRGLSLRSRPEAGTAVVFSVQIKEQER